VKTMNSINVNFAHLLLSYVLIAGTLRSHGVCDDDGECTCQAEVAITNLSRCNLGEDACNLSCTTTGHASGKCEEEENGSLDCQCIDEDEIVFPDGL